MSSGMTSTKTNVAVAGPLCQQLPCSQLRTVFDAASRRLGRQRTGRLHGGMGEARGRKDGRGFQLVQHLDDALLRHLNPA
jgi:hypothetical protein